jgi:hypothetical protein
MTESKPTAQTAVVPFEPENLEDAVALSQKLAGSNLLPMALRKRPEDVLVTLLAGREMGLSPMQAIRNIHVIEGRPTMSAELMVAQCLRHPEICELFEMVESTAVQATFAAKRQGRPAKKLTYSLEDAKVAGLANRDNWRKSPKAMLRARAASALARAVFPDLVAGVYEIDEGDDIRCSARDTTVIGEVVETNDPPAARKPVAPPDLEDAEVVAETPTTPAQDRTVPIRERIAAARSVEDLHALVPEILSLTTEERAAVKPAYGERLAAIKTVNAQSQEVSHG